MATRTNPRGSVATSSSREVSADLIEVDGDRVVRIVLQVRDHATGVADDARERIFEAFYTTKPAGKGTGLGLSIARDIVTGEFGGTLACTASGPDGTTFTIRLPVPAVGDPARAPAAA